METSCVFAFSFLEDYPATAFYHGAFKFPKHFYGENFVGEFDTAPELECAKALEMSSRVKRWVRNVKGMFGLPTSTGTFYPDFYAGLDDGRALLVEYKGAHLIKYEQDKKNIGERWEDKSKGNALSLWAIDEGKGGRTVRQQREDKIRK